MALYSLPTVAAMAKPVCLITETRDEAPAIVARIFLPNYRLFTALFIKILPIAVPHSERMSVSKQSHFSLRNPYQSWSRFILDKMQKNLVHIRGHITCKQENFQPFQQLITFPFTQQTPLYKDIKIGPYPVKVS